MLCRQLAIICAVAPGSDLHLYTSVKRTSLAQAAAASAPSHQSAQAQAAAARALEDCMEAVHVRYGAFCAPQAAAGAVVDGEARLGARGQPACAISAKLVACAAHALDRIMM